MPGERRSFGLLALGLWLAGCVPHGDPTWPSGSHESFAGPSALQEAAALARVKTLRQIGSGYHVTVLPSNLRPIGSAAPAFAQYLTDMHKKVHPVFADGFLSAADRRSANDPLGNPKLSTTVELVIEGKTGHIARLSIVRPSGLTEFDGGVIVSLDQAAPFGEAPPEIRSPDGNVHLQWELRRDRMACSTLGMHPLLLKPAAQ
jgi:hypothetical protein